MILRGAGHRSQAIIEFSTAMVILALLVYGMVQVFRWGMVDMVERRWDHDQMLSIGTSAAAQLRPVFHQTRPMDALWFSNRTN